jgi:hypothetical protein
VSTVFESDVMPAIGEVFDTLRDDIMQASTDTLKLLTASSSTAVFTETYTVADSWIVEYGTDRETATVRISDSVGAMTTAMATITHFKVNTTVYLIKNGGVVAPHSNSIMWVLQGDRVTNSGAYVELW